MNRLFIFECKISFFFENFFYWLFRQKHKDYYSYTSKYGINYRLDKKTGNWEVCLPMWALDASLKKGMFVKKKPKWIRLDTPYLELLEKRMKKTP